MRMRLTALVLSLVTVAVVFVLGVKLGQSPQVQLQTRYLPMHTTHKLQATGDNGTLRIMSLNAAHCRGRAFHQAFLRRETLINNITRIADLIIQEQVDIALLQEIDKPSVWSGHFDQIEAITRATGLEQSARGQHGRGKGLVVLDYGTAILSRFTLSNVNSPRFEQSWYDNKGYTVASMHSPWSEGAQLELVSVHLDFLNASTRRRQIQTLIADLKTRPGPFIIAGDFNCDARERGSLQKLMLELDVHSLDEAPATFPSQQPKRRIDWIMVSPSLQITELKVLDEIVSDHRAVVAVVSPRHIHE